MRADRPPMSPSSLSADAAATLSVVIPCFNEERTLARCLDRLLEIADDTLSLEIRSEERRVGKECRL